MTASPELLLEADERRIVLNVGCGPCSDPRLEAAFPVSEWREVRLDIDPAVSPDIVASIINMECVASASVDAVWSSHNLEHLFAHEVPLALSEFFRVLKPGGSAIIAVPDLQGVAKQVSEDHLEDPLYISEVGPIGALDIIFGHGISIASGNTFMAHKTGFSPKSLGKSLMFAGFEPVIIRRLDNFELVAHAHSPLLSDINAKPR